MIFQRARTQEHREIRRQSILDTAAAMLEEMPVSEVRLNELSRRVGLAKSAMLRYFESREAVLLELLDIAMRRWVAEISAELDGRTSRQGSTQQRGDYLAALASRSLQQHIRLCDLIAAQPGILEHNVSAETLLRFKRSIRDSLITLTEAVRRYVPELGDDSRRVCMMTLITASALWTHARPSTSALAARQADPALADLHVDFAADLEETLTRLITGTVARRSD